MNVISFFTIAASFLFNSLFHVQGMAVDYLDNPNKTLGSLSTIGIVAEPIRNTGYEEPEIEAEAALVIDKQSNKILLEKDSTQELPMASLTKLMTALIVVEEHGDLSKVVPVPEEATTVNGSEMDLESGEEITILNLLKGLLINSGNDAAVALAHATSGSVEDFVELMNQKKESLGLDNTQFSNPHGLDNENHYSTARDLAKLSQAALNNSVISDLVRIRETKVQSYTESVTHQLENTNDLLFEYDNVTGLKTGTTYRAGQSLILSAVGEQDQTIISVLLNSPDRFAETEQLLNWSFKAYSWLTPLSTS